MRKLLLLLAACAGVATGGSAAYLWFTPPTPHLAAGSDESKQSQDGKDFEYVKLQDQFIIPLMDRQEVDGLVVISLSLEVYAGMADEIVSFEPLLRDRFLTVLFRHAQSGGFGSRFTSEQALADLRRALRFAARQVGERQINDVLIRELIRQDL